MKTAIIVLSLFISSHSFVCAEEISTWVERSGYTFSPEHKIALDAAKQYTKNERINGLPVHYEYQISPNKSGFYVFVVQYTLNKKLEKSYYPGGFFSLDVDKNGKVIKFHPGY